MTMYLIRAVLLAALTGCSTAEPPATPPTTGVTPVLSTGQTVLGQYFAYPTTTPHVTSVIVTLPPGAETGLHHHDAPLFGYVLEGELTVAYHDAENSTAVRTYRPGDGLIEAIATPHNGRNTGSGDVRILVVFIGAEGMPITVKDE
jgi:quercetin dioxygenase-like cupin family protein